MTKLEAIISEKRKNGALMKSNYFIKTHRLEVSRVRVRVSCWYSFAASGTDKAPNLSLTYLTVLLLLLLLSAV